MPESRHALIGDIHGNAVALEAVLDDIAQRRVDRIVCLGDIAAGGPQPREVIGRLRELGCPAVRGNADRWLLEGLPAGRGETTRRIGDVVAWARDLLAADELGYLAALPPTLTIAIGSWTALCCHGSPRDDVEALLAVTPDDRIEEALSGAAPADAVACGHTHLQLLRPHPRGLLLNPGSVGLPLGSLTPAGTGHALPAWAEYGLVGGDGRDVEIVFRRVPVDRAALARATDAMPQPTWAGDLARRIERWNARSAA